MMQLKDYFHRAFCTVAGDVNDVISTRSSANINEYDILHVQSFTLLLSDFRQEINRCENNRNIECEAIHLQCLLSGLLLYFWGPIFIQYSETNYLFDSMIVKFHISYSIPTCHAMTSDCAPNIWYNCCQ